MKQIVISIRPEFATKIYNGTKKFELRKSTPKIEVGTLCWIYETKPVGLITGCFRYAGTERCTPKELWFFYNEYLGIDKERFLQYYKDCKFAHAWRIRKPKYLNRSLPISAFKLKQAPQSYCFVDTRPSAIPSTL